MKSDEYITVQKRPCYYIVICPKTGMIDTKPYQELAEHVAKVWRDKNECDVYIVRALDIDVMRVDGSQDRIYKMEVQSVPIAQELL